MERDWPLVSIAMPCYNRGNNLEKFIRNIRSQSYPQDKIEIVLADYYSTDNTLEVAERNGCIILRDHNPDMEYRRTVALKKCKGTYVFIADDDNFFVNPDLIKVMVEVIEKEDVSAVECVWEYYDKNDYAANRYCSLFGTTDPTTYYLHMQDHMPISSKKWILNGTVVKETAEYFKVRMKPEEIPTMGDQGFLCRKQDILKAEKGGIILHMDICSALAKEGKNEFVFLKDYFGHNHVKNVKQLMKKLKRNIDRFNQDGKEREMNYDMSVFKMIRLGLVMGTFIIPLIDAIFGFAKIHDWAWFLHPIICFRVTLCYTISTLKSVVHRRKKSGNERR